MVMYQKFFKAKELSCSNQYKITFDR